MKRWQVLVGVGAVALLAITFFALAWGKTELALWRCNRIAERGQQGWGDEVSTIVSGMISRSSDKHRLAERLLAQPNGSLVSDGLILLVQENHRDGKQLISQYLHDQRWNYQLELNSTTASNCLRAYVSQNKHNKTQEDLRNIAEWRYSYVTHDMNELERPGSSTNAFSTR